MPTTGLCPSQCPEQGQAGAVPRGMWQQPSCSQSQSSEIPGQLLISLSSPSGLCRVRGCRGLPDLSVCGAKFISATVPRRALAGKPSPNQTARECGAHADPVLLFQKGDPTVSSLVAAFQEWYSQAALPETQGQPPLACSALFGDLHTANPCLVIEIKDTSFEDVCSRDSWAGGIM